MIKFRIFYWIAFLALLASPVLIALYLFSSTGQSNGNPDTRDMICSADAVTHIEDVCM
ncbi:hypothetical protein [Virgibacillus siamensis]|uniref:hypothetical protein n=1 Tax=Virgibacillus siamensis TaxID=480071 RepID=UPI00158F2996|nr:hypothetical protein [Virgibacillus siamensis]